MRAPDHLNALRAFEAAARHLSFALAAEELNVTPAAVGQLVRRLEEVLGAELFHRSQSGPARLVLTEAAEAALPELQTGFDHLTKAMERLKSARSHRVLSVTVSIAFADKWVRSRPSVRPGPLARRRVYLLRPGRLLSGLQPEPA
jgi:LysR family glycine cleavage system transcriptional activator